MSREQLIDMVNGQHDSEVIYREDSTPDGYRELKRGEYLQAGDRRFSPFRGEWYDLMDGDIRTQKIRRKYNPAKLKTIRKIET